MLYQDNYFAISVKLNFRQSHTHWIGDQDEVQSVTDTERFDCLKDSEPDSYDENDMKEKVNDLVRLHKAIQEKLKTASYSEQIHILTLVPDKWSRMHCSEYFNILEYIV